MENYETIITTISLALGASWASGINLYAVLLVLGLGGASGSIDLPPALSPLTNPMVIAAAGFMYCVEFFADKVPGVDTSWDALHTFIRIPAGAFLAAGAIGDLALPVEIAAAIVGGGVASVSHSSKAGARMLINTSPEPFSNIATSISEDLLVLAGLWAALNHPSLFLAALLLFLIFAAWALPKLWRLIKRVLNKIARLFGQGSEDMKTQQQQTENFNNAAGKTVEPIINIERLYKLKTEGALTDAEFEQLKRDTLKP